MEKPEDRAEFKFSREDRISASLLQIAVHIVLLKRQLREGDLEQLTHLRSFLEAADKLTCELGYGDDANATPATRKRRRRLDQR